MLLLGRGVAAGAIDTGPWNYFDNTYWTPLSNFSWTGTLWRTPSLATNQWGEIQDIGSWVNGFRPSSVDISYVYTFGVSNGTLTVYDSNGGVLGSASFAAGTGTVNIPLTFGSYDINKIRFTVGTMFTAAAQDITDIWFNA